jgi:putative RNA methylase family UPF0020
MAASVQTLARDLNAELGPPHVVRLDYEYVVPTDGRVETRSVPAAIFMSPTPSLHSAFIAFSRTHKGNTLDRVLRDVGYLGAPIAIVQDNATYKAFAFTTPLSGEQIGSADANAAPAWLRSTVLPHVERSQVALPLQTHRELILAQSSDVLEALFATIIRDIARGDTFTPGDFAQAIRVVRAVALEQPAPAPLRSIVTKYRATFSLANLPLESIAHLYESFGLDDDIRRDTGTYYTPPWLARYLVGRLPLKSLLTGRAVDPACGSGTFLVAFLERALLERARRGTLPTPEALRAAVLGIDRDQVAIEATRLTLDIFAHRIGSDAVEWELTAADSTKAQFPSDTLIGNLPFGYRTFEGKDDVSAVILNAWLTSKGSPSFISVLLPESFAYSRSAAPARRRLRMAYRLEELIKLPEGVFSRAAVSTLGLLASRAEPADAVLVRSISNSGIDAFRDAGIARSFVAALSAEKSDPWTLSPFYKEFSSAREHCAGTLTDVAFVRIGLQAYGVEGTIFARETTRAKERRVLEDPAALAQWSPDAWLTLRRLVRDPKELRRTGPIDLFPHAKVIIRSTTNPAQRARLLAVADEHGIWFTDKFIGIWLKEDAGIPLRGLAAYLQTRFAEAWFATFNPSRKARISTLEDLPIPKLPSEWWERATELVQANEIAISPRWVKEGTPDMFRPVQRGSVERWRWFERAVEASFRVDPTQAEEMELSLKALTSGKFGRE